MNFHSALCFITILLTASTAGLAQPASPADVAEARLEAARQREAAERDARTAKLLKEKWQVRTNVLMVSVPEAAAIELLPSLRNSSKIDEACARIMAMIARKEARLIAWPEVVSKSGERALSEGMIEERYAVDFHSPSAQAGTVPKKEAAQTMPTAFETRNTGATLEVEAVVNADGASVLLHVVPQHVGLAEMRTYFTGKNTAGEELRIQQPIFQTMKTTVSVSLLSGQRILLGTFPDRHASSAGGLAFLILQAEIIPATK